MNFQFIELMDLEHLQVLIWTWAIVMAGVVTPAVIRLILKD